MRSAFAAAPLLFAAALSAQTSANPAGRSFLLIAYPNQQANPVYPTPAPRLWDISSTAGCPIQFSARRWGSGATQYATRGQSAPHAPDAPTVGPDNAGAHGVSIGVHPLRTPAIKGMTLVVHGFGYRPHMQLVDGDQLPAREQMFQETAFHEGADLNLLTDQVPLVRYVDITEITYDNGSSWRSSTAGDCRAEVSGLMLVGSSR